MDAPPMKMRIAPWMVAGVVLGAAALSLLHTEQAPAPAAEVAPLPSATGVGAIAAAMLPPNHPPIDPGATSSMPHTLHSGAAPAADEAPAVTWRVPERWQTAPNPNAMRIATYHPSADTEVTVSRAGGATEANLQRWIGQFDETGADTRTEKTVRGLAVKIVEVSGTYLGGGMMPGPSRESHRGWTLVGAVVETPGTHYFFKLLGPAAEVRTARASFDALLASIGPV
jgi:hypothetical protein